VSEGEKEEVEVVEVVVGGGGRFYCNSLLNDAGDPQIKIPLYIGQKEAIISREVTWSAIYKRGFSRSGKVESFISSRA
jgi:hypothetical protein